MKLVILLILLIFIILLINNYKNSKIENFNNNKNKKIALCFLIYDKINQEELWYNWLKNVDHNKYNIYIHYKENKPLNYFEKYKVKNTIKTDWCDSSLVDAQNILLKEAFKDEQHQHFIFISNSCIPVKSFDYIYSYLDKNKSYLNLANPHVKKNNLNIKIYKASQWCILNKKHVSQILDNTTKLKEIYKLLKNQRVRGCPDEHSYISLLYDLNKNLDSEIIKTPNLSANSITYTGWSDMSNYKNFKESKKKGQPNNYSYICEDELKYLVNSKSLFARKFEENCKGLENLLELIK